MAALHQRPLGLYRRRLDLDLAGAIWLGHLSLRPLDALARSRLGLGAGRAMGSGLGFMAEEQGLCRLGAVAAGGAVRSERRHSQLGR